MTPPPTMTTFVSAGRELDPIVSFVNPSCFASRILPIPRRLSKTIRTEAAHIFRRFLLEQRFDQQPSDPSGAANSVRIATAGHDKTFHSRTFADNESSIGRKRRPAFANARLVSAARFRKQPRELFF